MTKMTLLFAFFISSLLAGCATQNGSAKKNSGSVTKTPQLLELERKAKEREQVRQDQKDKQRVLSKKSQLNKPHFRAVPQKQRIEMLNPVATTARNEKELYAELVGSFDRNDEIAFFSRFQAYQSKYSKSALADDAIYLAGLMSLSNKNYGPALRYFNQVLKKYPASNKASSSLFAKGVALKKMNLIDESRQVFVKVQKAYPGSPEALRAENEIKIMAR